MSSIRIKCGDDEQCLNLKAKRKITNQKQKQRKHGPLQKLKLESGEVTSSSS